jgi:hypothetical protein
MATKKSNGKGKGKEQAQVVFPIGTRHETVRPSMATLSRMPSPVNGKAKPKDDKSEFLLGLLKEAGSQGVTWVELQAQLKAKYGLAPKKRHSLYRALKGQVWHKTTEAKGIVRYFLGKAPKVRSRKQA